MSIVIVNFISLQDGDGQEETAGAVSDWGFAGHNSQNEDNNGERKQRRNKSSSGNRKSKVSLPFRITIAIHSVIDIVFIYFFLCAVVQDSDLNHLPGINGASGRGDHSPRGYKNDSLPHI